MRTVLVHEYVTGGGLAGAELPPSWAAEGAAMRRALAEDFAAVAGIRVVMTLDDRLPAEPGPWQAVRVGPGREWATFGRLAAEADSTALIAPETAGLLLARARLIQEVGGRSLGPTPGAIQLAGDKLELARHWLSHGVPTPPTLRVRQGGEGTHPIGPSARWPGGDSVHAGDLASLPHPLVIKPIDGAGSIGTFYLETAADRRPDEFAGLVQPFLPGTPMSASFLVDAGGEAHLVGVARQRIAKPGGRFTYLGGTVPAGAGVPLAVVRRAVDSVPGLQGWVGADFLWDGSARRVTVLELNPRPSTSYVGFRRLLPPGELAAAWLDAAEARGVRAGTLAGRIARALPLDFGADGTIPSPIKGC